MIVTHDNLPVENMTYPIGYHGYQNDKRTRILGYLPVVCLLIGPATIMASIKQVYDNVIRKKGAKINKLISTNVSETVSVSLSRSERAKVLALSVALFFRGFVEFCQLGFVFFPFDKLYDHMQKKPKT